MTCLICGSYWVQVWSSSSKPLLSGLSWASLVVADVCLAAHVRTDCSYLGCQFYIQTSQQDIWWLPFLFVDKILSVPIFHRQSHPPKKPIVWTLWLSRYLFTLLFPSVGVSGLFSCGVIIFCHFHYTSDAFTDDFIIRCVWGGDK